MALRSVAFSLLARPGVEPSGSAVECKSRESTGSNPLRSLGIFDLCMMPQFTSCINEDLAIYIDSMEM